MATAILNSDGLEISNGIKFLETQAYELYGDVSDMEGKGIIVDLDFLIDNFGAKDEKGTVWTTPCPSTVGEWAAGVNVAMKDLVSLNLGTPKKIWVPGSARPLLCKSSEPVGSYYFACACENCSSDEDIDTIRSILEQLAATKTLEMSEMLKFSESFQMLVNQRKKLTKKFDTRMKNTVLKYFPDTEVGLYTKISVPFLPGSFDFIGPDYAVSPSMLSGGHQGELLLQDVKDFRLAPIMFRKPKNVLMILPTGDVSDTYDMSKFSSEFSDYMAFKMLEDIELRHVAERYINLSLVPEAV